MKKIIAVLLILCMLSSSSVVFGAEAAADEQAENEPIVVSENVKLLAALDIFDEEFFTKPADQKVTRGEFAYMVSTIDKPTLRYETSSYTDVAADNPYLSEIEYAKQNDYIEDFVDGKFRPDAEIKYEKVLRALVHLTGNERYAAVKNYDLVVMQLGLADGVTAAKNDGITFEQAAQLLVNTITRQVLDVYAVNTQGDVYMTDTKHENILERNFNIFSAKGIVNSTYVSTFNSSVSTAQPGEFIIDGTGYDCGKLDMALLLGYNVDFYYRYDKVTGKRFALYRKPLEDSNKITEIDAKDVIKPTGKTLNYYRGKTKRTFAIKASNPVVLNGRWITGNESYSPNIFDMDKGKVYIVDNGIKTFVSVTNIKEVYVASIGTDGGVVITTPGASFDLAKMSENAISNIIKEGSNIAAEDIVVGDVFEIVTDALKADGSFEFEDKMYVGGTVTSNYFDARVSTIGKESIKATTEEKTEEGTEEKTAEYEFSAKLKKLISQGRLLTLKLGATYTLYFNADGEVSYYEEKRVSGAEQYGIVLQLGAEEQTFEADRVMVKLLCSDGEIRVFDFKEKIILDGESGRPATEFITNFNSLSETVTDRDGVTHTIVRPEYRMIRYETASENVIRSVDTCKPNLNPTEDELKYNLEIEYGAKSQRLTGKLLGNRLVIGDGAPYFAIPRVINSDVYNGINVEDEKYYGAGYQAFRAAGNSGVWFNGVSSYSKDKYGVAKAIAIYSSVQGKAGAMDISKDYPTAIVLGMASTYEDGEVLSGIEVLSFSGTTKTLYIEDNSDGNVLQCVKKPYKDDGSPNIVEVGDIIRYCVDGDDYLTGIDISVPYAELKKKAAFVPKLNASGTPVGFGERYVYRLSYGLAYSSGSASVVMATDSTVDEYGNVTWDFTDNSKLEVVQKSTTCRILEYDKNGVPSIKHSNLSNARTYENFGMDADMMMIGSSDATVGNVTIVRFFD